MEALSSLPSPESSQSFLQTCLAPGRCQPGVGRTLTRQSMLPAARLKPTPCWQVAVMQPMRELCQALGVAVLALGRLLAGIAGYADYLVAGRGRVLSPLESNPP